MARFAFLLSLTLLTPTPPNVLAQASRGDDQPDLAIDAKTSREIVEQLARNLNEAYIFPETAKKMEWHLRGRLEKKEYDNLGSAKKLAGVLTEHLQALSKDKHLR